MSRCRILLHMYHGFSHSQLVLKRQFLKLFGNNFRLYDPSNRLVLFSHQKAFRLKEDIRVYSDESRAHEVLSIRARQVIDFSAAYDVVDPVEGTKVGGLKRKGFSSIVRDHWIVMDEADREIGTVVEDSVGLALVRRVLTSLVPQNYDLLINNRRAADFRQRFNPFVYHLEIDFGPDLLVDRRLGVAAALLLAAIEGRQG